MMTVHLQVVIFNDNVYNLWISLFVLLCSWMVTVVCKLLYSMIMFTTC